MKTPKVMAGVKFLEIPAIMIVSFARSKGDTFSGEKFTNDKPIYAKNSSLLGKLKLLDSMCLDV